MNSKVFVKGKLKYSGTLYDPLEFGKSIEKLVCKNSLRKYYRFRGGEFYGGIATADCVGCNLSCAYCWSFKPRKHPADVGRFYSPAEVFERLTNIASARGYPKLRVSGNEPTLGREHLLELLALVESTDYLFILETNGICIGADETYAEKLSRFRNLHVRVSLKGCTEEQFSRLTGARPEAFKLQLKALEHLVGAGVGCHPAIIREFTSRERLDELRNRLREIDPRLPAELEFEFLIPFPHVVRELAKKGIYLKDEVESRIRMNY
jgi:uncharacterized Fe-S cluster-containing radical SAM superfamily protein